MHLYIFNKNFTNDTFKKFYVEVRKSEGIRQVEIIYIIYLKDKQNITVF